MQNYNETQPAELPIITQRQAAKLLNVSRSSVQRAAFVIKHGIKPLQDKVRNGELSVNKASEIAKHSQQEQAAMLNASEKNSVATCLDVRHKLTNRYLDTGKWHSAEEIAEKLKCSEREVLFSVEKLNKEKTVKCQRKEYGTSYKFRFFSHEKPIPLREIETELQPIMKGLLEESKKNAATFAPLRLATLAHELKKAMSNWAK